jgi:hypothetical protein
VLPDVLERHLAVVRAALVVHQLGYDRVVLEAVGEFS